PELLELSQEILNPAPDQAPLVLADSEHYTTELLDHVHLETPFELLVPMPPPRSLFASNRAAAQSLITVSFSVTVNDQRIIISNPSWPPSTVTKSRIWLFIIHNAGISKSFSNSTKPWVGIGPVRSTSTSVTDKLPWPWWPKPLFTRCVKDWANPFLNGMPLT